MTEIIIIRHGETEWNVTGRFQGHSDIPLSSAGHEQARLLGKNIVIEGIDKIYASDLVRAVETAEPLAARFGLSVEKDVALRELNFGAWEGRYFSEINEETPDLMKQFYRDPESIDIPRIENFQEFRRRVAGRVRALAAENKGKRIAIVSHGASIRILFADILSMPVRAIWHVSQFNTAVNRIRFEDDGFAAIALMNDTAHLSV